MRGLVLGRCPSPAFKRAENWEEGGDRHRGGDGPLQTTRGRFEHPLYDAFLRAGESLGYGRSADYNGAQQEGFARVQYTHTHRTLRRCSSAYAYLRPARRRPNLRVLTRAHATRVLLEGDRAVGIEYLSGGERRRIRAEREVLVCAGAYQSPQLLMLSGIGPPDELHETGIDPRRPLPGVGRNLQDHFGSFVQHECRQPITFYRYRNPLRFAGALAEYFLLRRGPLTVFPMDAVAHLRSDPALERPDIQIYLCPMRVNPIREGSLWPREHGFNLHWNLLRPESRGVGLLALRGSARATPDMAQLPRDRRGPASQPPGARDCAGSSWPTRHSPRSGAGRPSRAPTA